MKMLTETEHSALVARAEKFDIIAHLERQAAFSERTFGPGARIDGVCDHIAKELIEARFRFRAPKGEGEKLTIWYELIRPAKVMEKAFHEIWDEVEASLDQKIMLGLPGN